MNPNIKITTSDDQKLLIIREGNALELREPIVINISGDIDTVKSYVAKRYNKVLVSGETIASAGSSTDVVNFLNSLQTIEKDLAVITFDKNLLSISLDVNPQDYYGPQVTGKMQVSDELKPFGINEAITFNREGLVKLLRFNKRFFSDADVHDKVLKAFQSLSLTGNTEIKADSDTRGNKGSQFKKTINSQNVPTDFYLTMPIFKGQPAVKFLVEVCLDNSESSVTFWFESVELAELQAAKVDEVFTEQKELFKDFVIVNK